MMWGIWNSSFETIVLLIIIYEMIQILDDIEIWAQQLLNYYKNLNTY